jgi:hypothetical protein
MQMTMQHFLKRTDDVEKLNHKPKTLKTHNLSDS